MTRPEEAIYDVEHDYIAEVTFTAVPPPSDTGIDGIELYVGMHDGSVYSFTAYTPGQAARLMEHNGWLSFVDLDMLIIKEPTLEAVFHALEQVVLLDVNRFGIQINPPELTSAWTEEDPWAGL